LDEYTKQCEFVFHLAGVNRPKDEKEFMEGNFGFTSELLALLKKHNNKALYLLRPPYRQRGIIHTVEVKRQQRI